MYFLAASSLSRTDEFDGVNLLNLGYFLTIDDINVFGFRVVAVQIGFLRATEFKSHPLAVCWWSLRSGFL